MNELLKKLKVVEQITSYDYENYKLLIKLCNSGLLRWTTLFYNDDFNKKFYDIFKEIKEERTWITFDFAIELRLFSTLSCTVICKKYGYMNRLEKYFTGVVQLEEGHLPLFEKDINWQFNNYVEAIFEKQEEERIKKELSKISKKLLL